MSKWATIDKDKLEREVDDRAAALKAMAGKSETIKGFNNCLEYARVQAEYNALVTVFNCISRPGEGKRGGE